MFDGKAFGAEIVGMVREYVDQATAPLLARIGALERELADRPEPKDGKDADPAVIERMVAEAVAAIPAAKDGESVAPDVIRAMVDEAVAALPAPQDGKDGVDGRDGLDGQPGADGKDGVDGVAGREGADGVNGKDGAPGSDGVNGKDGADGLNGRDGADGKDGEKGLDGKDGVGLAGAVIDRSGALVFTLSVGSQRELGQVIGKDGAPGSDGNDGEAGKDGVDGLGFEDMDLTFDGERKLIATFTRGEVSKAVEIEFPVTIHRGVYKADATYARGDCVTWAGSSWIAQRDTNPGEKPEASDAWLLSVKRGRDGKDGAPGLKGEPGVKGDPGRDGRSH